jgi:hypothetical protein
MKTINAEPLTANNKWENFAGFKHKPRDKHEPENKETYSLANNTI